MIEDGILWNIWNIWNIWNDNESIAIAIMAIQVLEIQSEGSHLSPVAQLSVASPSLSMVKRHVKGGHLDETQECSWSLDKGFGRYKFWGFHYRL